MNCLLCQPDLAPVVAETAYWRVILNRNQNLLGKLMLVLRRHAESITALTPEEWLELHVEIGRTTCAVSATFQPDHFNYVFLQNQDRHVHLHIVPRYAGPRVFRGVEFTDPDYPAHYTVPSPVQHLSHDMRDALADVLQQAYQTC